MQKRWRNTVTGFLVATLCLLGVASSGMALEVAEKVTSNAITIIKHVGDDPVRLVMSEQCTEPAPDGGTKFCLCQGVCFRIAQILASTAWEDGVFRSWDVEVETGWNTEGPEEFFEDAAEVRSLVYHENATSEKDLTMEDSWYRLRVVSTGREYLFRGTSSIYMENFLDLRKKLKNGTITDEEKVTMQALRQHIVQFLTALPFNSEAFDASASQGFASSGGGGSGGCSMGNFSWVGMLLLGVPGMVLWARK